MMSNGHDNDDLLVARRAVSEVVTTLEYLVRLMKETGTDDILLEHLRVYPAHYHFVQALFSVIWDATDPKGLSHE